MLKSFSVTNFKGFKDKITFCLNSPKNYTFNQNLISNGCVTKGIIYGINGSGKSNLGLALFDIVRHLTENHYAPVMPGSFFNLDSSRRSAEFEYIFEFDGTEVTYRYSLITPERMSEEHLFIGGKEVVFYDHVKREGFTKLPGTETLNGSLDNEKILSRVKFISNNSLYSEEHDYIIYRKFMDFVDGMLLFYSTDQIGYQGFMSLKQDVGEGILEKGKMEDFQKFLMDAEIDYSLKEVDINGNRRLFCHFDKGDVGFFDIASTGTKSLALFYYWYIRMTEASFVYIDEFDAFYHFDLAVNIVKRLNNISNVQIFMTTHNTDLMSNDLMRPDCYFILSDNNIKPISDLTDKELRQAHNLQKMYKAGAFNA